MLAAHPHSEPCTNALRGGTEGSGAAGVAALREGLIAHDAASALVTSSLRAGRNIATVLHAE